MKNLEDIEILAALENLRIRIGQKEDADYALRVASAIVAEAIGYKDRYTWSSRLRKQGLTASEYDPDGKDRAEVLYNCAMGKLERNYKTNQPGEQSPGSNERI